MNKLKALLQYRAWYYVAGWAITTAVDSYMKLWKR